MPGRDGTGPQGRGSRTGRGMGRCTSAGVSVEKTSNAVNNQPVSWGGRGWINWINNLLGHRGSNRVNRK